MRLILSLLLSLCSVLGFSQTILYQAESTSRTVQDPQAVIMAQGFHAKSDISKPFLAKLGPATENSGGGPTDSQAGANNPTKTTETDTLRFHDTRGNIDVTQAGQLQYTLAIELPPGMQKTAPNINLAYVSGAGNGLVGYGWNISGITSISRVGKNIEKDGITKGVQLDYSDYYSFNGQRLILKSGEYGKDGAEYVTEKYSNIKIRSIGTITGQTWQGPEYWEITFEDGSQTWYGAIASGNSSARTAIDYNIVKSKDSNGNYITYNYIVDGNVSVINSIEWGGNEPKSTPHFNKIDFVFGARPQAETAYIKGIEFSQTKMLQSIVVSTDNKQYKKYNLFYRNDAQISRYKYLDKISILNSKNEEAEPVIFTYEKFGYGQFEINSIVSLKPNSETDLVGDFDGDGNLDLLRYHSATSPKIKQTGLYLYSNFYKIQYDGYHDSPVFVGNSELDLKNNLVLNFKKDNIIHSRQGFVTARNISISPLFKTNLHLDFYSINDNQLSLNYKKIIPNAAYDASIGIPDPKSPDNYILTQLKKMREFDLDGDGLSEIIFEFENKTCFKVPTAFPNSPWQEVCINENKYFVLNTDQDVPGQESLSPIQLYGNRIDTDVFSEYRIGDFNGDGLLDFIKLDNNKPQLITFKKTPQGKYESSIAPFNPANDQTLNGYWQDALVGDFNGDGLADIVMPGTNTAAIWYKYISTGRGFKEDTFVFERPERDRRVFVDPNTENIRIYDPRTFVAYDINNDGKTDLIQLEYQKLFKRLKLEDNIRGACYTSSGQAFFNVYSTFGGQYSITNIQHGGAYPIYLNENNRQFVLGVSTDDLMGVPADQWTGAMLKMLAMGSILGINHPYGTGQSIVSTQYYDTSKEGRINSVTQGGVTTNITYKQLDKSKNPGLYDGVKAENYPYVEINQSTGMYVVSELSQDISSTSKLKQNFKYRGLTSNILGRGMIGFKKTARSSWYADGFENTKIWSGAEIDPTNEGIPVKEWSIKTNNENLIFPADVSENNSQLLSFKQYTYKIDKLLNGSVITNVSDADKPKIVTAINPHITVSKDFLKNIKTVHTVLEYDNLYLPKKSIINVNNGFSITNSETEYYPPNTNSGSSYSIGKPKVITSTVQAYGDTKSTKEEYIYNGNLLKSNKTYNRDNTGYFEEIYSYDDFGNVNQKESLNSIDSQSQITTTFYDNKGKFAIKSTDNLGLETNVSYNDWGQITKQTDPLGNTSINVYDSWGKIIKSKSNLSGTVTYTYSKDKQYNSIVTQYDPDGNITKKFTNKLGQEYKVSTKGFKQEKYVSKDFTYDILGRKIGESEPYFEGQTPNKWNTISYDDSVFPAVITSTTLNGKQVKTSVSGNTTTEEETNGNLRITTKTADALGNIISSTDKGGTIQFSYDASGQQIQAKYAENIVTTQYDSWGRKSELNDPSNGVYKYEYYGFGQTKKVTSPKGIKEYTYNKFGQLISQKEMSTTDGGKATNKTIAYQYDDKGRLVSKSGTSQNKPYNSNTAYDAQGRLLSVSESSNGKYFIQKAITYDDKARIISYEKSLYSSGLLTKVNIENIYSEWNGELYQIKDKNTGKVLWQLNEMDVRGQVSKAKLGSIEITNKYDTNSLLTEIEHTSTGNPTLINIKYTFDAIKNELKSRTTSGSFNILENFGYDTTNRLTQWTDPVTGSTPVNRNIYDAKGRILENDQVGKIKFDNPSKIYQPTGMTLNPSGVKNYNNDLVQSIIYNENNDPIFIDGEKGDMAFQYGLTTMRQMAIYGGNFNTEGEGKFTKYYSEAGSFEVIKNNTTGKEKHILYIGGTPYESNIIYLKNYNETTGSYKFLHKDYLGSILAISDEAGNKLEQRHFDAWGHLTHLQIANGTVETDINKIKDIINNDGLLLERGYTSHEHFTEVGIIHMNGRLYDPLLRRFLSPDENIQDLYNTQNYNKYGYVLNNPMMYNDPNGEFWMLVAGALVGGYFSGAQANGSWNPVKWDWQKSWGAVLGGAIAGASLSGTLGNIASNPGAIKNILPGIVSGGLNSAFNGNNFLGGAISGLSYTGNLSANPITSTSTTSSGYRYIVSPYENMESDWEGLTKSILLNYVKTNFCTTCSSGQLQQKAGIMFENAFHSIIRVDYASLNYTSNDGKIPGMYKGRPRNTIPDGIYDLIHDEMQYRKTDLKVGPFNIMIPIPNGTKTYKYSGVQFAEVKAMDGTLYTSSNSGQIASMIGAMAGNRGVRTFGGQFIIGTTSDTVISKGIHTEAALFNIQVIQMRAQYRMVSGLMEMRLIQGWMPWAMSPSTTFIK
ncbi:FG-GAP-like repeat-containing protein [Chryseobacterium jejuense]|uniref:Cell wall-associated polypeptide CWBP200 n=1 Tax=Chryseobacterium jejuense TaxID=445960 RepID=A0A2X2XG51_CHRJE|nr:FG-GAP-like repeat-containing protein [Chryseobacterium jejuense]SDI56392.1 RHS repeat-associated core domain-containing protein [Chryseobacterium jejuense]SQB47045.1 Cell wall-associated polypeptide CWBP200 [Chryseobacterium jejuense]